MVGVVGVEGIKGCLVRKGPVSGDSLSSAYLLAVVKPIRYRAADQIHLGLPVGTVG